MTQLDHPRELCRIKFWDNDNSISVKFPEKGSLEHLNEEEALTLRNALNAHLKGLVVKGTSKINHDTF